MSDKVLHRKMFRQKALELGKVKPVKAMAGFFVPLARTAATNPAVRSLAGRAKDYLVSGAQRLFRQPGVRRTGEGLGGLLQAAETPYGVATAVEGAQEDNVSDIAGGLGFTLAGLGQLIPGVRNVSRAFRRRGRDRTAQGMSDAGSKTDRGLAGLQSKLEGTPGVGRVAEFGRKRPLASTAGAFGLMGAGEGVDQVLGDPLKAEDIPLKFPEKNTEESPEVSEIEKVDVQGDRGPFTGGAPVGDLKGRLVPEITKERFKREDQKKAREKEEQDLSGENMTSGGNKLDPKQLVGDALESANNELDVSNMSFKQYNDFIKSGNLSVKETALINENINKQYDRSRKEIQKARDKLDARQKETFDEYYSKFKEYSGANNDKEGMYLLWNLGTGLANARTNQSGFAGFLDSLNQAGGEVFETAFALNQRDKQLRQSLAANFLDYERQFEEQQRLEGKALDLESRNLTQQIAGLGLSMAETRSADARERRGDYLNKMMELEAARTKGAKLSNRKPITFYDKSGYMGGVDANLVTDASGNDFIELFSTDAEGKPVKELIAAGQRGVQYEMAREQNASTDKARNGMIGAYRGYDLVNKVIDGIEGGFRAEDGQIIDPKNVIGSEASINQFMYKFDAIASGIFGKTLGSFNSSASTFIDDNSTAVNILNEDALDRDLRNSLKEMAADDDEYQKLLKDFNESLESRKSVKTLDKIAKAHKLGSYSDLANRDDSEAIATRKLIAKLSVYEHKLTYLLANASKFEDRLTQKDVQEAREKVSLMRFTDKPIDVLNRYKSIREEIKGVFEQSEQNYLANGGSRGFILGNFKNMPNVKTYIGRQNTGASKQKVLDQNVDTVAGDLITAGQVQ